MFYKYRSIRTRYITVRFNSSFKEKPRVNQLGVQYISNDLHKKVFPHINPGEYLTPKHPALLNIAKSHLQHHELLGKPTQITEPITINHFPQLIGNSTLDEHFYKIGKRSAEPYLSMAEKLFAKETSLPGKPSKWLFSSGWTRYAPGSPPKPVPYPTEDELVFDVEVLYKRSNFAVLATCASTKAWYGWVSPLLTNHANDDTYNDFEHLIPFNCLKHPKLLVGYNVSYDRARVLDEYNIRQSKAFYLDGMALHVAISGICSQQRPKWMKHRKSKSQLEEGSEEDTEFTSEDTEIAREIAEDLMEDPWLNKGSPNSLANVLDFHCGQKLDKTDRDYFSSLEPSIIIENFQGLMDYCAKDVDATYTVTKKLFPEFRVKVPHPVSFAALRHLGTLILPTTKKWEKYIENVEKTYEENRKQVTENLRARAKELVQYVEQDDPKLLPDFESDPWLRQLNWSLKEPRLKKDGTLAAKQAFLTGYPEWYRDLFKTIDVDGVKEKELNITLRTRITPLLLRLKWEGYPLIWYDSAGWCFNVPFKDSVIEKMEGKNYTRAKLNEEDLERYLLNSESGFELFKIPHGDGPNKRCTSVLSKSYSRYFENETLTSEYNYAREILSLNNTASYWMGNRNRIMDQFVVYSDTEHTKNMFFEKKKDSKAHPEMGIIIPKLCTMGTITRRATENTWLTASNAKKNRIGSELKSLIEAPSGYCFVGADVDSEELWIASLVGDSLFKMHGATALGWMTLEGDKNERTDLHSKTAEILGISRNDAKIFNYGRIYGAGVKFATRLLKQFNVNLSDKEAEETATRLYQLTKGNTANSNYLERRIYHGGTESVMFNALESIAYQEDPKTPVLGASITDALTVKNLNKNVYLTSRINWAIQSSGVDYLHLLIVSMDYLIERYQVDARLAITVHDELRYLSKEEDKYRVALLLQISNLWTRSIFCEQMGIHELPQSIAFFSDVDIDHVLRKEVSMDCVTPSNPTPIRVGESLDIRKLLEKCDNGNILEDLSAGSKLKKPLKLTSYKYTQREPVISRLDKGLDISSNIAKVRLQNSLNKDEWRKNISTYIKAKKQAEIDENERAFLEQSKRKRSTAATQNKPKSKAKYTDPPTYMTSNYSPIRRTKIMEEYDIVSDGSEVLQREYSNTDKNDLKISSKSINSTKKNLSLLKKSVSIEKSSPTTTNLLDKTSSVVKPISKKKMMQRTIENVKPVIKNMKLMNENVKRKHDGLEGKLSSMITNKSPPRLLKSRAYTPGNRRKSSLLSTSVDKLELSLNSNKDFEMKLRNQLPLVARHSDFRRHGKLVMAETYRKEIEEFPKAVPTRPTEPGPSQIETQSAKVDYVPRYRRLQSGYPQNN